MKVIKLLPVAVGLLLLLDTPSSAVAQLTLTNTPTGTVFCNGSEVIFTCGARESAFLEWSGDDFYVGSQIMISFAAEIHRVNATITSLSNGNTVATLTKNEIADGVRELVSTLRILATSDAPSGNVMCASSGGTTSDTDFQVLAPPAVPQDVVTFQLEHVQSMCAISSVVQSPTNPARAATTYTVSMDDASVPHSNADLISTDGRRHTTLVYNSSCGAHRIRISASNMCGQSPGTDEIVLDPQQRFMLNVTMSGGANNIECSVTAVIVGALLVAFKSLLDLP